ncbi:ABC transporter ATP-binding protein [Streptosporangium sp. NPDC020072]|uniref:ABC transporter ATP-binding protein n=1 Tax=Streptosporangium sp. NPDC020072 TaxID=3154788 RepID=UPI00342C5CBC
MSRSRSPGQVVLRRALGGRRRLVLAGSVLRAGHQAGEATVPVLIGLAVDQGVVAGDLGALLRWLAVLAVVYLVLSFSYRFGARASDRAMEEIAHTLRAEVVGRVLHPGGGAESGRLPGALAGIATEDARRVGALANAIPGAAATFTGLLAGAAVLLWISVPLGLVVLAGAPALLWLGHLLSRPLERRSATEQDRAARASGVAADLVAGLRVLKGIGAERAALDRYRATSRDSLAATMRAARAEALQNGVVLALTGCLIAVVGLSGGRLAVDGRISLGDLISAVGLALFLIGPLQSLARVNTAFAQARASATRIAEVLATPPAVTPGAVRLPRDLRGGLSLRAVGHAGLRGIDLEVAPGELLGVAATDPADALALLRCLDRRADPETGTVELDGVSLRDLDPGDLRSAVLVAAHDADLFEGTLLGNVGAVAEQDADLGRVMAAAGADEVARALPYGQETAVAERGRSLSGGQRQRVALARALAADRPVLVVHDPTTAVDTVTEARIAAGIRELRRGRTTIMVTTSPALLTVADRVVLLDGGRIVETGPHTELARRNETYRSAVLT